MTDCIIIGVVLIIILIIANQIWTGMKAREIKSASGNKTDGVAASVTDIPQKEGVTTYTCAIASADTDTTKFKLSFDSATMKYTETMYAGEESSGLDEGSYTLDGSQLVTTSTQGKKKVTNYIVDGDYLLVADEMYNGEIPSDAGTTFEGTFTYDIKDEGKTTMEFMSDGTYKKTIESYAAADSSQQNQTASEAGTYECAETFISLKADSGQPMLPYYVYKGKITNAYYTLDK